jgi:phage replication-related protein YjqB (UPF0714/DUF867 family)
LYETVKPMPSTYKIWVLTKEEEEKEGKHEHNIVNIKRNGSTIFVIARP